MVPVVTDDQQQQRREAPDEPGDHIRRRLADRLRRSHGQLRTVDEIAAALEQTVRALMDKHAADELDAAADDFRRIASPTLHNDPFILAGDWAAERLDVRAAALRARTEETI